MLRHAHIQSLILTVKILQRKKHATINVLNGIQTAINKKIKNTN